MRCLESCRMKYKDIEFKTRRTQVMKNMDKNNGKILEKLDTTNLEDLPDYIQPSTYLFNKKKFEKLPEQITKLISQKRHQIN